LEAQHRKNWKVFREEVIRLTSLLEQALGSKSVEEKFTAQPEPMLINL